MKYQSRIYSTGDARLLARKRLPRMIFDFIEGAAGREVGARRNETRFDDILLQPRAMTDVANRSLATGFLGRKYGLPFGIAPMGMCNLACPKGDQLIAGTARKFDVPIGLSSAGSSSLEDMRNWAGDLAWFQVYFGQSARASFEAVDRARDAGYDTLILTVDVPVVSRRIRDLRNDFNLPFRMTPRAFVDFLTHPRWSVSTLINGIPSPRNLSGGNTKFDRKASRTGADWAFLSDLRGRWPGHLIVKGITSAEDAKRIQGLGADAVYVSNHGARQLDSAPAAIDLLPLIREAVGPDYPLLFDSGVRNGEDVVKALALGADFIMLGRPALFALAAAGGQGLNDMMQLLAEDIDLVMAQIGACQIKDIGSQNLFDKRERYPFEEAADQPEPMSLAT